MGFRAHPPFGELRRTAVGTYSGQLPTEKCTNMSGDKEQVEQEACFSARYTLSLEKVLDLGKNMNYDLPKKMHPQGKSAMTANCYTEGTNEN